MSEGRPVLSGVRACLFDAYGTLFNVHSAVQKHAERIGSRAASLSAMWRTRQVEYTWLRTLMGRYDDFEGITREALDYALSSYGVDDTELRNDLMDAYFKLWCYPEVPTVLTQLRESGMPTAILSNGSPAMLQAAVRNAGLDGRLDAVISVDEVQVYKPDARAYALGVARLGYRADEMAFMSSNYWDAAGAAVFGYRVVWVNRYGQRPDGLPGTPEAEIETLAELPRLLKIA